MKNFLLIPVLTMLVGCGPGGDSPLMMGTLKGAGCYETVNCVVIVEDPTVIRSFGTGKVNYTELVGKRVGVVKAIDDNNQVVEM